MNNSIINTDDKPVVLEPRDRSRSVADLQREAKMWEKENKNEYRVKQILAELVVRTVIEYSKPDFFTHYVSTTPKSEALKFLKKVKQDLLEFEQYEHVGETDLLIAAAEMFHKNKPK
ncbi:MAG: hypothetical protein AABY22_36600 [Nanoarchaeota archaeon]